MNNVMVSEGLAELPYAGGAPFNLHDTISVPNNEQGKDEPVSIENAKVKGDSLIVHIDRLRGDVFLMDIRGNLKRPVRVSYEALQISIQENEIEHFGRMQRNRKVQFEDLTPKQQKKAEVRFAVIQSIGDLDDFFANHYGKGIIKEVARKHKITQVTVYKILWAYLYNERNYASLGKGLGKYANSVPKKERTITKPLGRRSSDEILFGLETRKILTNKDFQNFEWCINIFKTNAEGSPQTLMAAFQEMLNERYVIKTGVRDNSLAARTGRNNDYKSFEEKDKPSWNQFYYWLRKTLGPKITRLKNSKFTKAEQHSNLNGRKGNAYANIVNAFQRLEIDETPFDEEIVSESGEHLGKPTVYLIRCARTGYILGFHSTLAPPSVEQASIALYQCFRSRASWLNYLGLPEFIDDWEETGPGTVLVADNAEFDTIKAEHIFETLNMRLDKTKPASGNDKPYVETSFKQAVGLLPNLSKGHRSSSPEKQRRNSARNKASLTIEEVNLILMENIIHFNNKKINENIDLPREAIADGVPGIPRDILRWYENQMKSERSTNYSDEDLRLALLPRSTVSAQQKGLYLRGQTQKLFYHSDVINGMGYQDRAGRGANKSEVFVCTYDPNDVSKIWVHVNGEMIEAHIDENKNRYVGLGQKERDALDKRQRENELSASQEEADSLANLHHFTKDLTRKADKRRKANQGNRTTNKSEVTENRKLKQSRIESPLKAPDSDVPLSNQDSGHNKNNNTTTKHTSWRDEE